jgi:hypothetical protein
MFSKLLMKNEKNENFIKIYIYVYKACMSNVTSTFWGEILIFM